MKTTSLPTSTSILHLKKAFSLVELIVVIGILGILAGILFVSFGGATESARAAQCMTNLRNLATAANAHAMKTGWYPLAGSREAMDIDPMAGDAAMKYKPQYGWVSWLDQGMYEDGNGNRISTAHKNPGICPWYGAESDEENQYAITNGVMWKACSYNRNVYTCPERAKKKGAHKTHLWHYVMNAKFGYDYSKGSKAVATFDSYGIWYGSLKRTDRVLMFAEMALEDPETGEEIGDGDASLSDCTLQYKATINGHNYNKEWSGAAETIGFPHKHGKRGRCGHVAFADGHVEKLMYSSKGLSLENLTTLLCEGLDVVYSPGKGYVQPTDTDKMDE